MFGISWRLGRLAGIGVYVHWTFLLLLGYVGYVAYAEYGALSSVLFQIVFTVAVFGCVVLHELGHALMARRFGIATKDIILLPIGGVARLERMPTRPVEEFLVAVSGPMVNGIIAVILCVVMILSGVMNYSDIQVFKLLHGMFGSTTSTEMSLSSQSGASHHVFSPEDFIKLGWALEHETTRYCEYSRITDGSEVIPEHGTTLILSDGTQLEWYRTPMPLDTNPTWAGYEQFMLRVTDPEGSAGVVPEPYVTESVPAEIRSACSEAEDIEKEKSFIPTVMEMMFLLIAVNLFLGIFNLIPAFPMDGGRIFRALLASFCDYVTATRVASFLGQLIAVLFLVLGLSSGGFVMVLIAIFIFLAARAERSDVIVRWSLRTMKVRHAAFRHFTTVEGNTPLPLMLERFFSSFQNAFPVYENERFIGFVSETRLMEQLELGNMHLKVRDITEASHCYAQLDDSLETAYLFMAQNHLDVLPVVERDEMVGVLTRSGISRLMTFHERCKRRGLNLVLPE